MMFDEFRRIKSRGLLLKGDETGGASLDGEPLSNNASRFLDSLYSERSLSDMLTINRRIFSESVVAGLAKLHPFYKYMYHVNADSTLLSYYDTHNEYKDHHDDAIITCLTWFYEEPKKFMGGDFVIENDLSVECKANRTVFMPSYMMHKVDKVKIGQPYKNRGFGRYTMTQFTYIVPSN